MINEVTNNNWPPFDWSIVPESFICPKCKSIIDNAVQAHDCGCQYCLECLSQMTANGYDIECLKCNVKLESDAKYPDKNLKNKILKFLNNTVIDCKHPNCGKNMSLINYKAHYTNDHVPQILLCKYCQKKFPTKSELESHNDILTGDCTEQPLGCPFKTIGCVVESNINSMDVEMQPNYFTRKALENHMTSNQTIHLRLVHESLGKRIDALEKISLNFTELNKHQFIMTPFNTEKADISKSSNDSGIDSRYLESSSLHQNKSYVDDTRYQPSSYAPSTSLSSMGSNINMKNLENKFNDLSLKLNMLENNHKTLITDLNRLQKSNDNFRQENLKIKESNKEYKMICQDLHRTLALTQVSLLTLEERLINQEKLSYNGTLLWKITNVQERIQEAKSGRQTSFYSPPFYTERNGFKMCARIYLNGDGNGRNTHLSLFFVILRGEYDALLKWPFRQKVTFILIDQSSSESKENVYDAFRPDPNSSSFRRPVSEMNIASGLPVFCPLGKLLSDDHEYIKDNTMFIKIIVDTKDLSEI